MKILKFACLSMIFLTFIGIGNSQATDETKIVIVEKTTDNNGNVVTHTVTKTGEDAKKYMAEKKEELGVNVELDGKTKTIRKEVKIEVNDENSSKSRQVKVVILDDDGNEKELQWDGNGEMPEEMKKFMKEEDIDIDVVETNDGNVRVEIIKDDQPRLGVIPENHVDGVQILDIIKDSAADKAGLEKGDVIFKINDETVGSTLQLKDRLGNIKSGENATIFFIRNGEEKLVSIKL